MKTRVTAATLLVALILSSVPAAFLVAPHRAHAIFGAGDTVFVVGGPGTIPEITTANSTGITSTQSIISAVKSTLIAISTYTSQAAEIALVIKEYVLEPLAFVVSGNLLKAITAGIIGFVDGQLNGTGAAQFVQNIRVLMQGVSDVQSLVFLGQFLANSNSPFAHSISSSLRSRYLEGSSVAGFFAANQCTLLGSASDIQNFLHGRTWSAAQWFSLTTQDQNDPYVLHALAQNHMALVVSNAVSSKLNELSFGQGFLSWCGESSTSGASEETGGAAVSDTVPNGTAPGDSCTRDDGTQGEIKTPGSVIKDQLQKVLGSTLDKLVGTGSIVTEINGILGDIATVMSTVSFAQDILGGGQNGGLFGYSQPSSGGGPSPISQYAASAGYFGVTQSTVYKSEAQLPSSGSDMKSRIAPYRTAWQTIGAEANTASSSVTNLINFCTAQIKQAQDMLANPLSNASANPESGQVSTTPRLSAADLQTFIATANAQISEAQTVLANDVSTTISQAQNASTTAAKAQAFVDKVQAELNSPDVKVAQQGNVDTQALQTMAPTAQDVADAEQQAQTYPTIQNDGSTLIVSAPSLFDKMRLIGANASTLQSKCTIPKASSSTSQTPLGV